jgi:dTDP-glucose 4,6-dehydratase
VKRFIHISTSEVYGSAVYTPMDEEHPLCPSTPYASAKAGADRLVYSYWKTYKIPAIIIRPFNNYGPYQHLEKLIPRLITSMLMEEGFTIHGRGEARRDWIYVEDTCEAIYKALKCEKDIIGEVINIGTGRNLSVLEVAKKVAECFGVPEEKIKFEYTLDRFGQVQNHCAKIDKAKKLLSFEPKNSFEEGLRETIKWYKENRWWWEKMLWLRKVPVRDREGKILWW